MKKLSANSSSRSGPHTVTRTPPTLLSPSREKGKGAGDGVRVTVCGPDLARRLSRDDRRYIWHPYTQMQDWVKEDPLIIREGRGVWLKDICGKRYLDGVSSIWLNVHGHRHPKLDAVIRKQVGRISHSTLLGLANVPSIELAKELIRIAPPGLAKVFYSDSGSEAVECALKMDFQYWQHLGKPAKRLFVCLENAYHGDTVGAMSLGKQGLFHGAFAALKFETISLSAPYPYRCAECDGSRCAQHCAESLQRILSQRGEEIAAVVVEPLVQAAAGMIVSPPGFLARVRELTRQYGVHLLVDEVATGFGRTGKMFACEEERVQPDLMAIGKGLTGGYLPLAATLTTQDIYDAFLGSYAQFKTFFHGHSYTGNPLGCAVALACLETFRKEKTLAHTRAMAKHLSKRLEEICELRHVGDIRQKGLMVGVELVRDKATKEPYRWEDMVGIQVARRARNLGVFLRPLGPVMVLMPPLSIQKKELDFLMDVLKRSIQDVTDGM